MGSCASFSEDGAASSSRRKRNSTSTGSNKNAPKKELSKDDASHTAPIVPLNDDEVAELFYHPSASGGPQTNKEEDLKASWYNFFWIDALNHVVLESNEGKSSAPTPALRAGSPHTQSPKKIKSNFGEGRERRESPGASVDSAQHEAHNHVRGLSLLSFINLSWSSLTGQTHIDPRVKLYCGEDIERWAGYFVQQLLSEDSSRLPRGRGCFREIDTLFDIAAAHLMETEAGNESVGHQPLAPSLGVGGGAMLRPVVNPGTENEDPDNSCSCSSVDSAEDDDTIQQPHLQPLHNCCMVGVLPGDCFMDLMEQLAVKTDIHFIYLCFQFNKTLREPVKSGGSALLPATALAYVDRWCVSRSVWRRGWVRLGGLSPHQQRQTCTRLGKEYEALQLDSEEFKDFYSFLWAFMSSTPTSAAPSPPGSPSGSITPQRRSIPKEDAIEVWRSLELQSRWPYINDWLEFLNDQATNAGKRGGISSDQWHQFALFMPQFTRREHFQGHDTANSSWPSVIDEFVEWMTIKPSSPSP